MEVWWCLAGCVWVVGNEATKEKEESGVDGNGNGEWQRATAGGLWLSLAAGRKDKHKVLKVKRMIHGTGRAEEGQSQVVQERPRPDLT